MISNPLVVNVTLFIALLSLLATIYFTARAIGFKAGQKTNGYVKQSECKSNMESFTISQSNLHEKFNSVVQSVAEIKGYLKENL